MEGFVCSRAKPTVETQNCASRHAKLADSLVDDGPMIRRTIHLTYKAARRIAISVVGATIVLLGVVMLVTPGPGLVVIPVGLAILSIEFAWARHWLRKMRESISRAGAGVLRFGEPDSGSIRHG